MIKERAEELTESGFAKFVDDKKAKLAVVDFFAEWCMPCTMMAPVIEELAEKNSKNGVKFGKINVDDSPKLSTQYQISSIPCIVFFKNGKEAARIVGAVSADKIQGKINELM